MLAGSWARRCRHATRSECTRHMTEPLVSPSAWAAVGSDWRSADDSVTRFRRLQHTTHECTCACSTTFECTDVQRAGSHLVGQMMQRRACLLSLVAALSLGYRCFGLVLACSAAPCRFEADRDKGDFSDLPELHALSSGLKATCTAITAGDS